MQFLVSMGSPTAPNLVVVSYETLRSDIGDAGIIRWDYVVLDEGHYIRNPTSAVHKACKELIAQRRLVLVSNVEFRNIIHMARTASGETVAIAADSEQLGARHSLASTDRLRECAVQSGTPIQNDVLELWSLFDFLMPGFLGTRRQFNAKFGKVLKESRRAGKAAQGAEEGVLALERLHR